MSSSNMVYNWAFEFFNTSVAALKAIHPAYPGRSAVTAVSVFLWGLIASDNNGVGAMAVHTDINNVWHHDLDYINLNVTDMSFGTIFDGYQPSGMNGFTVGG